MYTNFQLSSMNISVQRTRLYLEDVDRSWLGVLEDWVIFGIKFDILYQHNMSSLSCMPIFSSIAWLQVHQGHGHTWEDIDGSWLDALVIYTVADHLGTKTGRFH